MKPVTKQKKITGKNNDIRGFLTYEFPHFVGQMCCYSACDVLC